MIISDNLSAVDLVFESFKKSLRKGGGVISQLRGRVERLGKERDCLVVRVGELEQKLFEKLEEKKGKIFCCFRLAPLLGQ